MFSKTAWVEHDIANDITLTFIIFFSIVYSIVMQCYTFSYTDLIDLK